MSSAKKPMVQSTHITLRVKNNLDENAVFIRLKRSTQMEILMKRYCHEMSIDLKSAVFLFNGRNIKPLQTPEELEMEDDAEIDVMLHQNGGSVFRM